MGITYDEDDIARLAELIGEQFTDKLTVFVEDIDGRIDRKLQPLKDDVAVLKSDMSLVKATLKSMNKDLFNHKRRITALEAGR